MISVTILTKNSQRHLKAVLDSLRSFDEIIVLDNGSDDQTLDIAQQYPNVRIHKTPFIGFGPLHNQASNLAKHDWILSIDSDEILSEGLLHEIQSLNLNADAIYSFPRHTYYRGKLIRGCGWYPDRIVRIYNRKKTQFSNDQVHERILKDGLLEIRLKEPIIHYSYTTISDFLSKMQSYSELFAKNYRGKKKSSPLIALTHSAGAFFKSYFLKRGIWDGYAGFLISFYQAHTAFYKYLKLYEANKDI
ncbi:MAG: glycosyltransferase family 2 protein [Parachlamydiales bacterium]|nr:glycosyltransferase family 2 protein [Parachlamydiales bacterium]